MWNENDLHGLKEQLEQVFYLYKNYIIQTRQMLFWNLWEQHVNRTYFRVCFMLVKQGWQLVM